MKKALKPDGLLCCQGNCLIFVSTKNMFAAIDQIEVIVITQHGPKITVVSYHQVSPH